MKTRFRYISTGLLQGNDKISDFRLIGGNNLSHEYNGASVIRVKIPEDLKLNKLSCDSYSTTNDNRTLDELGYDILIWHSKKKRWIIHNELKGTNPCDFDMFNKLKNS